MVIIMEKNIIDIKRQMAELEKPDKRTPVWNYLSELYHRNEDWPELATLVMQQMVLYLDELEGPPPWYEPERENEYSDYYYLLQHVLKKARDTYWDCDYFLWQLYYYLSEWCSYHFIIGETIHDDDCCLEQWRQDIREHAATLVNSMILFEWVDAQHSKDSRTLMARIKKSDLMNELNKWQLQNNLADEEVKYIISFDEQLLG